MKAVYIPEPGKIEVVEREIPKLTTDTQCLIKVDAAGICGSDLHIYHGTHAFAKYPRVIGHEGSGTVFEVGRAVTDFKVGDKVVMEHISGCGTCYACRNGRYNCCPDIRVIGVHVDGMMEEYIAIESRQLHKYDTSLTPVEAATAEPYTIGTQANYQGGTMAGDLVLIHGVGPIGMIICDVAEKRGATVIASEVSESRLALAKDFGAKYFINPAKEDLRARCEEISGGKGINVIFDTTGVPALTSLSIELLGPHGRFVPLTFAKEPMLIDFRLVNKNELVIAGTRNQNGKFPEVLASLPGRKDRIDKLVTHVFPVEDAVKAFETALDRNSGACKVIVTF